MKVTFRFACCTSTDRNAVVHKLFLVAFHFIGGGSHSGHVSAVGEKTVEEADGSEWVQEYVRETVAFIA